MTTGSFPTVSRLRPDVKAQWVAALRSGEYEQTKGVLHRVVPGREGEQETPAGFCCLGVLCDLAVKAGVARANDRHGSTQTYAGADDIGWRDAFPPMAVEEWAYGDSEDGREWFVIDEDGSPVYLADLNDSRGLTFNEIADLIEASL